jgi:hypothetical protein
MVIDASRGVFKRKHKSEDGKMSWSGQYFELKIMAFHEIKYALVG